LIYEFFNPEIPGKGHDNSGILGLKKGPESRDCNPTGGSCRGLQNQVHFKVCVILHLFCDLGKYILFQCNFNHQRWIYQQQFTGLKFYCLSKKEQTLTFLFILCIVALRLCASNAKLSVT
jgi:hypothetical protein